MEPTRVYQLDGGHSVGALEAVLKQIEEECGALLAISVLQSNAPMGSSTDTWTTHALVPREQRPTTPVRLLPYVGDPPAPPSGRAICIGDCFIGGTRRRVLAYR
jgi:hypothetical protein